MELLPGPQLFSVSQTASQQIKKAAGGTLQRTAQLWNWNDTLTRELPSPTLSRILLSVQGISSPLADNKLGSKDHLKQSVQVLHEALPGSSLPQSNVRLNAGSDSYHSKHNMHMDVLSSVTIIINRRFGTMHFPVETLPSCLLLLLLDKYSPLKQFLLCYRNNGVYFHRSVNKT